MKTWTTSALSLLCVLGVACGDDNKAPAEKSFTYGVGTQSTVIASPEATNTQTGVAGLSTALNGALSDANSQQVAGAVIGVAANLFGPINGLPGTPKFQAMVDARTVVGAPSAASSTANCATITADKITYNCTAPQNGGTVTLNGYFQKVGGTLSWDLTTAFSGSDPSASGTMTYHYYGSFTVTPTTIVGAARVDLTFAGTYNGQAVNASVSEALKLDLAYYGSCITSGTVEAKLWWTATQGTTGTQDQAVKLTFSDGGPTACAQTVTIAKGQ